MDKLFDALVWLFLKSADVLSYIFEKLWILVYEIFMLLCEVPNLIAKSLNGWLIFATKIASFTLKLLNWLSLPFIFIWDHVVLPINKKVIDAKNIVWPFLRDKFMYPIIEFIKQTTYKTIDLVKRGTFYLQQKIIDVVGFIRNIIYKVYSVIYGMIDTFVF